MLCFLLLTLLWTLVTAALQSSTNTAASLQDDGTRPYIYRCRSPNMEIFTCWWRPIANQDNVTYTLQYTTGERTPQECPDYVSGGINSCFFDARHTQVWEMYCMNVTAHTRAGPIASHKHCVDVADIVEIDPPFNLSYIMLNESVGESGRSILLSWLNPIESQVREGWITLVYELRYRHLAQPDNWRVKERLREPHVELLDLPVGKCEFMVRCTHTHTHTHTLAHTRTHTHTHTGPVCQTDSRSSKCSSVCLSDRTLALILVTSIAIMVFLIVGLGIAPRGKRIKSFLLPPIPKPRIRGIEPVLLKKGKIDEINRRFSSFHGYKSPQYSIEMCYQVSVDPCPAATPYKCEDTLIADRQPPAQTSCSPAPYCRGPAPYCEGATPASNPDPAPYCEGATPPLNPGHTPYSEGAPPPSNHGPSPYCVGAPPPSNPGSAHPELMCVPGMDYSMILNPALTPPQDFYTCVKGVTPGGALHLVPCLPDALKNTPYLQFTDDCADKSSQLTALLEKQMEALLSSSNSDPSEAALPLLPHSSDTN
ncbi:prolactin receptor-like [Sinocyclocheilus anshuiensis]|uniref:prolactin receptor-like n=1 Tax=Sinocyclocheilus anshuiensis TaxID=1608454 RepID=UPI0007BA5AB6|nr:PREDICTED: prolactin receptor-like [Sinocyclocheilus anshuiensis]